MTDRLRKAICHTICEYGKYETGEGTCAALCLGTAGPSRPDCPYAEEVHGERTDAGLEAIKEHDNDR